MCRGPEQIARMDAQQLVQAGGITAAGQQLVKKLMEDGPGDHILLLRLYRVHPAPGCSILASIGCMTLAPIGWRCHDR